MASFSQAYAHEPTQMINTIIEIEHQRFKVMKTLAEGGNGHIFLVVNRSSTQYAMKRVIVSRHQDPIVQQAATREYEVMKKLINCNNILKPVAHEVKRAGDKYVHLLVMPFCNGSVLDAMNRSRQGLSTSTLLKIVYDTARGLYQMHSAKPKRIAHRDLKVENVLWNRDENCFQLCDFGSASTNAQVWRNKSKAERSAAMDDIERNTTVDYRAPEQCDFDFHSYKVDHRVDLWALGCMIFHLCFYRTPFQDGTKLSVMNGDYKFPNNKSEKPKVLIKLIKKLLHNNPNKRPTALLVLKKIVNASKSLSKPPEISDEEWESGMEDTSTDVGTKELEMKNVKKKNKKTKKKKVKKKTNNNNNSNNEDDDDNMMFDAFSNQNFFEERQDNSQNQQQQEKLASSNAHGNTDINDPFDAFFASSTSGTNNSNNNNGNNNNNNNTNTNDNDFFNSAMMINNNSNNMMGQTTTTTTQMTSNNIIRNDTFDAFNTMNNYTNNSYGNNNNHMTMNANFNNNNNMNMMNSNHNNNNNNNKTAFDPFSDTFSFDNQ